MAEAIELNLPLGEGAAESVEKIIKPLLDLENEKQNWNNINVSKTYLVNNLQAVLEWAEIVPGKHFKFFNGVFRLLS